MNFIQISFSIFSDQAENTEEALIDSGALSITFQDAQDQPILEPGVGETPLWNEVVVKALYAEESDCLDIFAALADTLPLLDLEEIQVELIKNQAWERAWMEDFKPMCFGEKLWIYPSNIPVPKDHLAIILDPGLAFGTGTHPTTAMCLTYLAKTNCQEKTVLDFGCGSGILAIAALKLGAQKAIGIDNDPQALIATRDNANRNQINPEDLLILDSKKSYSEPYSEPVDILIANILAEPLINLASQFANLLKSQGSLALSGILKNQALLVQKAYEPYFENFKISTQDDWVCLDARRK